MNKQFFILLLLALAVFAFIGCASTAQQAELPCWQKESCLATTYPESQWYFAFAEDTIRNGQNVAAREALEKQALGRMIETIIVNVSSQSSLKTNFHSKDGSSSEEMNFANAIKMSADAELVNSFTDSYHDAKAKKVYAFAAVRKADLVSHYAQKIESALGEAQRTIELAEQMAKADRKKDALEKLANSKKHIATAAPYRNLLLAVDAKSNLSGSEQASKLLKDIAALQIELEKGTAVFVTGTESIQEQATNIIIPKLQTMLSENKVTVTEKQEEASHILSIETRVCNARADEHFHYASACIKAVLTNVKTGKNELTITVNGRKEGGLNEQDAGERAFKSAFPELWSKIKDKIMEINL
ncbi:MAG: hypothetical protein FWF67_01445 [Fibromonadales bacterium]|nr:hypothetical protein [Fibromonadales bacterium]